MKEHIRTAWNISHMSPGLEDCGMALMWILGFICCCSLRRRDLLQSQSLRPSHATKKHFLTVKISGQKRKRTIVLIPEPDESANPCSKTKNYNSQDLSGKTI